MATLDSSIVNISLPSIASYFKTPLGGAIEWVIIVYLVATAGVLLTAGRLADMIGRKPVWATGLIIFTLGSALCGLAPTLGFLITTRAIQGIGGALIMAISPAMLTSAFPAQERGRALGLNAVIVSLGVSVGPTLGGIITETLTWRWIFYVNVPIGIIGLALTLLLLKNNPRRQGEQFDPLGAIALAVGLVGLTLGLSFGQEWGWGSPAVIGMFALSMLSFGSLYLAEHRAKNPVIDFNLLHDRLFLASNLSLIISFIALFSVSFMMPFYLEQLHHFPTLQSGLLLTPLPLAIACIAPFSGRLADRIGTRWLASLGLLIAGTGLVFISQLNAQSSIFDIIWRLAFTGVGQALFQSPNNSALMGSAPKERQGVASGFLATGRVVGQSVSVALTGAIFAGLGGSLAGRELSAGRLSPEQIQVLQQTFTHSFQTAFLACAAIAAIGVFASLQRGNG